MATRKPIRSNLGSHARVYDNHDVAILLRAAIEDEGSQLTFARRHGVNRPCLNMALNGKRNLSRAVTEALGLRKVYIADTRPKPREITRDSFYFIACNGHIKIGVTSMPIEKRLGTLSTGSAGKMTVLAVIKNASVSVEHSLHERFAKYRVRREWFKAAPEILAYIEEIKTKEVTQVRRELSQHREHFGSTQLQLSYFGS
jgi:Meiotically up-regulated gene 113